MLTPRPTVAGATVVELLEKSPGITVDNDGNISLRGKSRRDHHDRWQANIFVVD
jgi:hypothetical protein